MVEIWLSTYNIQVKKYLEIVWDGGNHISNMAKTQIYKVPHNFIPAVFSFLLIYLTV